MAMDIWTWVAIVVVALALALRLGFSLGRKGDDRGDLSGITQLRDVSPPRPSPPIAAASAPLPQGLTAAQLAEIERLLRSGRKIEAIKLYREATRMGLAESKDAVEAMEH
jgi:hypothetical protein